MGLAGQRIERRENAVVALEHVERVVVEQRRRHIGRVAVELPDDGAGARDVAPRVGQPDGLQIVAPVAARHVHHPVGVHGRGNGVHGGAAAPPNRLTGLEVVAVDLVHGRRDRLRAPAVLDDQGCGPGIDLVPVRPPALLAGAGVERRDERLSADVIPGHHQRVAVQRRRRPLAERVAHETVAEIDLPQQLPVEVVGVQAPRSEERVEPLPVGHRRPGGVTSVRLLVALVRERLARHALPGDVAGLAVERQHDEPVRLHLLRSPRTAPAAPIAPAAATAPPFATLRRAARRDLRRPSPPRGIRRDQWLRVSERHRGEQEDLVAPDDRRRRPASGDLHLPGNVLGLAPGERRIGVPRDAGGLRPAPLPPIAAGVGGLRSRGRDAPERQTQGRGKGHHSISMQDVHCASSPRLGLRAPVRGRPFTRSARCSQGRECWSAERRPAGGPLSIRTPDGRIRYSGCAPASRRNEIPREWYP